MSRVQTFTGLFQCRLSIYTECVEMHFGQRLIGAGRFLPRMQSCLKQLGAKARRGQFRQTIKSDGKHFCAWFMDCNLRSR